jgi:hypothetical protein
MEERDGLDDFRPDDFFVDGSNGKFPLEHGHGDASVTWNICENVAENSSRLPKVHDHINQIFDALRDKYQSVSSCVTIQLPSGSSCTIPVLDNQPTYDEMHSRFYSEKTPLPLHKALFIVRATGKAKPSIIGNDPRASYGTKTTKCESVPGLCRIGGDWKPDQWKRNDAAVLKPWKFTADGVGGTSVILVVPKPPRSAYATGQESPNLSSGKRKASGKLPNADTDHGTVEDLKKKLLQQFREENSKDVILLHLQVQETCKRTKSQSWCTSEGKPVNSTMQDFRMVECLISSLASSLADLDLDQSRWEEQRGPKELGLAHGG